MNRRGFIRNVGGLLALGGLSSCAAGDFGLTRKLGSWNRSFWIVWRILIYLILIPVYGLTMAFDTIINNTIQFWTGNSVVSKNETFEKDGLKVNVAHTCDPLRRTVITAYDKQGKIASITEMRETYDQLIQVFVNGEKKSETSLLSKGLAKVTSFEKGKEVASVQVRENSADVASLQAKLYPGQKIAYSPSPLSHGG